MLLSSVITLTAAVIGPREQELAGLVSGTAVAAERVATLMASLWKWYLVAVLINALLLIMNFLKYAAANEVVGTGNATTSKKRVENPKKSQ